MLNHFRTLLLNLTYSDASEHIPTGFSAKTLPSELRKIYDKLFAPGSSRFHKMFLAQSYLTILNSTGFQSHVEAFDNRISYDLKNDSYFKVLRVSNPDISDATFPIKVLTNLSSVAYSDYHFDAFTVSQVSNTLNLLIYSRIKERYLNGKDEFTDSGDTDAYVPIQFTGGNKTSDPIFIGSTGVSFSISNLSSGTFTASSAKTWEFVVESPFLFDVLSVANQLEAVDSFKILKKYGDVSELEEIYLNEKNPVYKLSVLLLAYITIINGL